MAREEAAERFWEYALSVYGHSAAEAAFLKLQDACGADVPMLLWCLWSGAEGRAVSVDLMAEAHAFSEAWRADAVLPLRLLRKGLKSGVERAPGALTNEARVRVAQTEQAMERLQMDHLAALSSASGAGPSRALAVGALAIYAREAGLKLDDREVQVILECGRFSQ